MKKFAIFIHGINFLMVKESGRSLKRLGFYVTAQIEASSPAEAEKRAFELIRSSGKLSNSRNTSEDTSDLIVEEIRPLSEWLDDKIPLSGFVFYDDPTCEWRVSLQARQDSAATP